MFKKLISLFTREDAKQAPASLDKATPPAPKSEQAIYQLGITENNRVILKMGYDSITMNVAGVNSFIAQLIAFRDTIVVEKPDDDSV